MTARLKGTFPKSSSSQVLANMVGGWNPFPTQQKHGVRFREVDRAPTWREHGESMVRAW